jgi:CheY-like chemotaxis protein
MTTSSGAEALSLLSNTPIGALPDILICDIAMPDEDGYAALQRVRRSRRRAASQRRGRFRQLR